MNLLAHVTWFMDQPAADPHAYAIEVEPTESECRPLGIDPPAPLEDRRSGVFSSFADLEKAFLDFSELPIDRTRLIYKRLELECVFQHPIDH